MTNSDRSAGTLEHVLAQAGELLEGSIARARRSEYDYKDVTAACKVMTTITGTISAQERRGELEDIRRAVDEMRRLRDEIVREVEEARRLGIRMDHYTATLTTTQ